MQSRKHRKTYVFGDIDSLDQSIIDLIFESMSTLPPDADVIFLGDIISSFSKTKWRPTFDVSISILRRIFDTLNYPILKQYRTIADVAKKFQSDLRTLYRRYQFDTIKLDNAKDVEPKFSKLSSPYEFSRHIDNPSRLRIVLGNNDLHAIVNMIFPITTSFEGNILKIISDPKRYNTPTSSEPNIYLIDVDLANLLYTYFKLCRLAYFEDNVLYIHYGGNIHYRNNVDILLHNGKPINPSKIVCGHEKLFGLIKHKDVTTCYFDMCHCAECYDGYYQPTISDMYLIVEDGEFKLTNTNYMLREDIANDDVYNYGRKLHDVHVVGDYDQIHYVVYNKIVESEPSSDNDE